MTLPELHAFIKKEEIKGAQNIHYYLLDLYQRYSNPLTTFILTLIGFSVAIHKKRGGIGVNLVYGFALTMLYILFQKISVLILKVKPHLLFGVMTLLLLRLMVQLIMIS